MSEDIFDSLYDGEKLFDVIRLVAYGIVEEFQTRRERFISETHTSKAVHITLITTRGLTSNSHSDIFQNVIVAESLFSI